MQHLANQFIQAAALTNQQMLSQFQDNNQMG